MEDGAGQATKVASVLHKASQACCVGGRDALLPVAWHGLAKLLFKIEGGHKICSLTTECSNGDQPISMPVQ